MLGMHEMYAACMTYKDEKWKHHTQTRWAFDGPLDENTVKLRIAHVLRDVV